MLFTKRTVSPLLIVITLGSKASMPASVPSFTSTVAASAGRTELKLTSTSSAPSRAEAAMA